MKDSKFTGCDLTLDATEALLWGINLRGEEESKASLMFNTSEKGLRSPVVKC